VRDPNKRFAKTFDSLLRRTCRNGTRVFQITLLRILVKCSKAAHDVILLLFDRASTCIGFLPRRA
jgi:hypothetical protein